ATGARSVQTLLCREAIDFTGGDLTLVSYAAMEAPATLDGGTLTGGYWSFVNGALNVGTSAGSTMVGVSVNGGVNLAVAGAMLHAPGGLYLSSSDVALTGAGSVLDIAGGLTFLYSTITLGGGGSTLRFTGSQSIATYNVGPGMIIFDSAGGGP